MFVRVTLIECQCHCALSASISLMKHTHSSLFTRVEVPHARCYADQMCSKPVPNEVAGWQVLVCEATSEEHMLSNAEPPVCLPHPPTVESRCFMCVRSVDEQDEAGVRNVCKLHNLHPLRCGNQITFLTAGAFWGEDSKTGGAKSQGRIPP
jgi:hypothetical protein